MQDDSEGRGPDAAVVIDIGGSKVAAALVDRWGRLDGKVRVPTVRESAQALIDLVVKLVREQVTLAQQPIVGVGIAVAGVVNPASGNVLWAPNLPDWRDIPLGSIIQEAIGLPTVVDYDGHLVALGEHWYGAGQGVHNMVSIIVGTGIGSGLILDGHLYRGSSNIAGAAGWMIVDPQHTAAPAARALGSLESVAAGPAIVHTAEQMVAAGSPTLLHPPLTMPCILQAAAAGDTVASAVLNRAAQALAAAIVSIVSLLNPDLIVLSGGVCQATDLFVEAARQAVEQHAQPISRRAVRIVPAALGDEAGLFGAARLVFSNE